MEHRPLIHLPAVALDGHLSARCYESEISYLLSIPNWIIGSRWKLGCPRSPCCAGLQVLAVVFDYEEYIQRMHKFCNNLWRHNIPTSTCVALKSIVKAYGSRVAQIRRYGSNGSKHGGYVLVPHVYVKEGIRTECTQVNTRTIEELECCISVPTVGIYGGK